MDESNDRACVGSSSAGGVRRARPRGGAARHSGARHGARLRPCASTARGHQLGNKPDRRGNRPTEPRPPRQSNSAGRWAHACKLEQRPFVRSRPSCSRSIEQVPAKLRARHGRATRPRPRAGARSRGGGRRMPCCSPEDAGVGVPGGDSMFKKIFKDGSGPAGRRASVMASMPTPPKAPKKVRARARRIPNRAAFACSRRVRSRTRSRLTAGGGGSAVGAAATATSAAAATARGVGKRDVASGGLAGAA